MIDTWLKHIVYEYALESIFDRAAMSFSDIDVGVYLKKSFMYSVDGSSDGNPVKIFCFAIWWSVDLVVERDGECVSVIGRHVTAMHYDIDSDPMVVTHIPIFNIVEYGIEWTHFRCKLSDLSSSIISRCEVM